jgi:hypothetical protein
VIDHGAAEKIRTMLSDIQQKALSHADAEPHPGMPMGIPAVAIHLWSSLAQVRCGSRSRAGLYIHVVKPYSAVEWHPFEVARNNGALAVIAKG